MMDERLTPEDEIGQVVGAASLEEAEIDAHSAIPSTLDLKALVEGVIFASQAPVSVTTLCDLLETEKALVQAQLDVLQEEYSNSTHGFSLVKVANGYQFRTKVELKALMARFYEKRPPRLTQPMLEVLSIIAYKQPIIRPEMERIRGVDCTAVIKTLLERELIEMRGRSELPGHPVVYGTTPKFLEWFQISSLADLPPLSEIEVLNKSFDEGSEQLLQLLNRDDGFTAENLQDMDETLHSVKLRDPAELLAEQNIVPNAVPPEALVSTSPEVSQEQAP